MTKKKKKEPEKKLERALTSIEKESIDALVARRRENRDMFVVVDREDTRDVGIKPNIDQSLPNDDAFDKFHSEVHLSTGFTDHKDGVQILWDASAALLKDPTDTKHHIATLNRMASSMQSVGPKDEIEGQLVAQLIVLHEHSMYWMRRAMQTDMVDFTKTFINASTKLVNRHHETLKTLMRYRQGADQKVVVQHVNVNQGGQAIVGHVTGGGSNPKSEDQPHASV